MINISFWFRPINFKGRNKSKNLINTATWFYVVAMFRLSLLLYSDDVNPSSFRIISLMFGGLIISRFFRFLWMSRVFMTSPSINTKQSKNNFIMIVLFLGIWHMQRMTMKLQLNKCIYRLYILFNVFILAHQSKTYVKVHTRKTEKSA